MGDFSKGPTLYINPLSARVVNINRCHLLYALIIISNSCLSLIVFIITLQWFDSVGSATRRASGL